MLLAILGKKNYRNLLIHLAPPLHPNPILLYNYLHTGLNRVAKKRVLAVCIEFCTGFSDAEKWSVTVIKPRFMTKVENIPNQN